MDIQNNSTVQWFPRELKVSGEKGDETPGNLVAPSSDRITVGESSDDMPIGKPQVFKRRAKAEAEVITGERENPHQGLIGKWLKNSMVGLFVGLTLFSIAGCKGGDTKPQPPEPDKPANEQVVPGGGGFTDFTSNEEFQVMGREALTNLHNIVARYGGDFYGKTETGPSANPASPEEVFNSLVKGESFYLKGSSTADPVEVKNIKELKLVYKQILAEVAKAEAQNQVGQLEESLKSSEYGQKVLGQMTEIAQKYGGNLYTKQDDGNLAPLSSQDAYQNLVKGKGIYFKGSKDADPVEIRNMRELATLYQKVLKEAAVEGLMDQGLAWVDSAVKDSEKATQILTHLSEITQKFGGNMYGRTKDGSISKDPITAADAYKSLAKGESIYLKASRLSEPVEVKDVQQLGTIYKSISKEIAHSGISMGTEWAKDALKDSQAAKDLLTHLNQLNIKYGGSFYAKKGGEKIPLSPLDAYEKILAKEGFYYQSSSGSAAREIKSTSDLITAYMETLQNIPEDQGNEEIEKTGGLLQKLIEEQLKKFMPAGG